jgi:hypothetical protein
MPYKVKIDHPNAGDTDLYIHGLGTFHNGEEATVDDAAWFRYRAGHAIVNTDIGQDGFVTYDPQLGPDLKDLGLPDWISITKVDDEGNEVEPEVDDNPTDQSTVATESDQMAETNGTAELDPALQEQMLVDQSEAGEQNVVEAPVAVVAPKTGTANGGGK